MSISGVNELSANRIFTIAELYDEINKVLGSSIVLSGVRVKGEVSSYKYYQSSGHIYMTLVQKANKKDNYGKDVFYRIDAKWWKGKNQYSKDKDKIKVGDVITVIGSINCYNVQSNVSIIIDSVHLTDEEGRSKAEREKLRLELEKKGYFDDAHKKPFPPKYPRAIGIITSQSGDARHDIEKTVQKKNPYVQLYLLHALVQGAGAGKSIANAIRFFDKKEDVDIIIIGRGGGDKLDLAAFDDAEVVEAIYNCNTYIIAGTGHTPDRTLADFAVDKL
ncbi:MAG: exodeoxyribonuclease VII large subunit, partial [Eubacterium sp.]|nr:exodeoxyribonuclease VII large subunit [Eubacterium sp.]